MSLIRSLDLVSCERFMLKVLYMVSGMPKCTEEKLRKDIMVYNLPQRDLDFYRAIRGQVGPIQKAFYSWALLWILKSLYYPIYMVASIRNIEIDDESPPKNASNASFGCLNTNCRQLSDHSFIIRDLKALPVFAICHPALNMIYLPLTSTYSFGLTLYAALIYFALLGDILFSIENHWHPKLPDVVIFSVTPLASIRHHRERARQYLIEVFKSMQNYYCDLYNQRNQIDYDARQLGRINWMLELKNRDLFARKAQKSTYLAAERSLSHLLQPKYLDLAPKVQRYIDATVPTARSLEWSRKSALIMAIFWLVGFSGLSSSFITGILGLMFLKSGVSKELQRLDDYSRENGCGFWMRSSSGEMVSILLRPSVEHHNWVFVPVYLSIYLPAFILISGSVSIALTTIVDIDTMLGEQLVQVDLAARLRELLLVHSSHHRQTQGIDFKSGEGCFDMGLYGTYGSGRRLSGSLETTDALCDHDDHARATCLDRFADLLIKIYVRNRLIKDVSHSSAYLVSVVLSFSYAASYISVAITILINRVTSNTSLVPIALGVAGLINTNSLVLRSTRVQSTTNRLIHLMWSLIAATDDIVDPRVRHMRRLMIKQVIVLNSEGTLRIHAFGLPVTYASLFEAAIWSSTLAIYSFNN